MYVIYTYIYTIHFLNWEWCTSPNTDSQDLSWNEMKTFIDNYHWLKHISFLSTETIVEAFPDIHYCNIHITHFAKYMCMFCGSEMANMYFTWVKTIIVSIGKCLQGTSKTGINSAPCGMWVIVFARIVTP